MTQFAVHTRLRPHLDHPADRDPHEPESLHRRSSERGGARLSMLMTLLAVAVVGYGASSYAPIAYRAAEYKDEMQKKVDQAAALGHTGEWVGAQLRASAHDYGVPPEAEITTALRDGRIEAAVRYKRPVPLPGFVYDYEFDHTARSGTFFKQ